MGWWLLVPGAALVGVVIGAARDAARYEVESRRRFADFDRDLRARNSRAEWDR